MSFPRSFHSDLRKAVKGEILSDPISRKAYSVDASIYEVEPLVILQPLNVDEVVLALQVAAQYNVPVTARGAATGITGGCLGSGLILDLSRHLTRILSINLEEQFALCEPGVIQDDLNRALEPSGYRLGPDTSTGDRATLGGMLANNSAGARSLHYGCMADHVEGVELCLASSESLVLSSLSPDVRKNKCHLKTSEGALYRAIEEIRENYGKEIVEHFPRLPRRVSGYNLMALLEENVNLGKIIAGSEGTLGIATAIKMRIVPKPKDTVLCLIAFEDMLTAMKAVAEILPHQPLSLEMIDDQIIRAGRSAPALRGQLDWLSEITKGTPKALLIVEFEGVEKAKSFAWKGQHLIRDPVTMRRVWELRKAGLGLLLSRRTYSRAIAFIEDIAVPPEKLTSFMEQFLAYLKSQGKEAGIYGHVGAGCLHIRPYFDLRDPGEIELMHKMMLDVCEILIAHGGVLSGEHGDGLVRSWLNEKLFGKKIYEAFEAVKQAFDPENRLNPGKIVEGHPLEENLRKGPQEAFPTFLDFSREGGFELAVDLCNGNGLCRKREKVMCPSFQASGDEYDTTRARAQALRGLIQGENLSKENFYWDGVRDVLDLCIACKGCKTECPSQVDMAKMKAEFLYQYQEKHGYTIRDKLFAHLHALYRFSAPFAPLVNMFAKATWILKLMGLSDRPLPPLAQQRFSEWVHSHNPSPAPSPGQKQVVLFNDTYTEFLEPQIGIAAVQVLERLGYSVIVPPLHCCGRPMISKGFLRHAKEQASALLKTLMPYVQKGIPIVGLEPSCILTLVDDFTGLLGPKADSLAKACVTFDAFVAAHMPLPLKPYPHKILVHGHCHQKALVGMQPTLALLRAIPEADVDEIPSGCCGMAGSFGHESEHAAFSVKIGELVLLPAIRKSPEALIVANGLSCRSQISYGTGRQPLHIAELICKVL